MLNPAVGLRGILIGLVLSAISFKVATCGRNEKWLDVWASMPQEVEPHNLPSAPYTTAQGVFENTTLRQTVYITQDVSTIRLEFSNVFGVSDLPITAATVALPLNGTSGSSAIHTETLKQVNFSGQSSFIVPNGAVVLSDPIRISVKAQSSLTVTVYCSPGQAGQRITGHPGSRTSSWLAKGNLVSAADLASAPELQRIDRWFLLSTVSAWLPAKRSALAIIGDSITDGRGSTTNGNDRWPDQLLARFLSPKFPSITKEISILNQAAGGNRVLADGLGPNALGRVGRDVLSHHGVKYVILFEGVNDIGTAATDASAQTSVGDRLISAYDQIVTRLHGHGIAVFGATITPMSGPGQAYGEGARESTRQRVNKWIRTSGRFDAVIDFDKAVRDPKNETMLRTEYDTGDYLHLNPKGYQAMAEAVELKLFEKFRDGFEGFV
ncbi:SGNH hydrolase-type esterase domain-containing protein [Podospora fimiseda]|uniref:SGNH hydrolase-type esterase domain-containing protein n=1 Tax=Podospora fimiseda TaxID=252190 RepID=A0AAN7BW88_9PEZI|nr:SGNH hydrolase-type esterase domain-containing protein [Podospora fimiseda]